MWRFMFRELGNVVGLESFQDFGITVALCDTEIQMLLADERRWDSRLERWVDNRLRKGSQQLRKRNRAREQYLSWVFSQQTATWSFAALCVWDTMCSFVQELLGRKLLVSQSVKLVVVQENSRLFNSNQFQIKLRTKQWRNGHPKP